MVSNSGPFPAVLSDYIATAVTTILSESGCPVEVATEPDLRDPSLRVAIVGMRHEDASGTCLLFCSRAILANCHPNKPDPEAARDSLLDDSCGELINLIVGYLRRLFTYNHLKITMTPPSSLGADTGQQADYEERGVHQTAYFATRDGESLILMIVLQDELLAACAKLDPEAAKHIMAPGVAAA